VTVCVYLCVCVCPPNTSLFFRCLPSFPLTSIDIHRDVIVQNMYWFQWLFCDTLLEQCNGCFELGFCFFFWKLLKGKQVLMIIMVMMMMLMTMVYR